VATIASRQHAIVKTFRAVARGDDDARALVDGWHLLQDAAAAGLEIERVAVSAGPSTAAERALLAELEARQLLTRVTASVMDALSPVRSPAGIVALVRRRTSTLASLTDRQALIVLVCDLQDPGNAGAVVRSAEAGGAAGVVFAGASADPWSWKALRAAMGSTFRLPIAIERDAAAACDRLSASGVALFAATPRDGVSLFAVDLRGRAAVVVGGEGGGLAPDILDRCRARITIPMAAPVESLNAAVAVALLVYEAARQRR
jgi:TrmH family RNA methyltransferase